MIRVLIVEDEPALARGLSLLITKNYTDFEVLGICKNGRDGLQNILELEPELVFTDITMPVMNGLDMIEEVQKAHFHTRFVILTGYADFEKQYISVFLIIFSSLLCLKHWRISCIPAWNSKKQRYICFRKNICNVPCAAIILWNLPLILWTVHPVLLFLFFRGHCVPVYTARPFLIRILHRFLLNI